MMLIRTQYQRLCSASVHVEDAVAIKAWLSKSSQWRLKSGQRSVKAVGGGVR